MKSRLFIEVHGFLRVFYPHPDNNATRKIATLGLFFSVGIIWILIATGHAEQPPYFMEAAVLVAVILGRMWDIEASRLLASDWDSSITDSSSDEADEEE